MSHYPIVGNGHYPTNWGERECTALHSLYIPFAFLNNSTKRPLVFDILACYLVRLVLSVSFLIHSNLRLLYIRKLSAVECEDLTIYTSYKGKIVKSDKLSFSTFVKLDEYPCIATRFYSDI